MSWKDRLEKFPLLLPNVVPTSTQCLEGEINEVRYVATHSYVPAIGMVYMFTFLGDEGQISQIVSDITSELGYTPVAELSSREDAISYLSWRSGCKELPNPITYRQLGRKKILSILKKWKVQEYEHAIKEILIAHEIMVDIGKRISFIAMVSDGIKESKREPVSSAILEVTIEFAKVTNKAAEHVAERQGAASRN